MAKKPSPTASETSAQSPASTGMPLFFKQPRAIDFKRHGNAAVKPATDGYGFAREVNSIPLNAIEFIEAAKHYPIVFSMEETPIPAAVVGLEKENYFVEADGSWRKGQYLPAYLRQYPFVFFEHKEEKKFFLCIDEGSPMYCEKTEGDAKPLYNDKGEPSEVTNHALQFCTSFYQHFQITKNFTDDLKKHGLLVPYQSQIQIKSGRKIGLGGFLMIDEKALNALPDATFIDFRKKGWLPFIYLMLASGSNWKVLAGHAASLEKAA